MAVSTATAEAVQTTVEPLHTTREEWITDLRDVTALNFSTRTSNGVGEAMMRLADGHRPAKAVDASDEELWNTFIAAFRDAGARASRPQNGIDNGVETLTNNQVAVMGWLRDVATRTLAKAKGENPWPSSWQRWRTQLAQESGVDSAYLEGTARWCHSNRARVQARDDMTLAILTAEMTTGVPQTGYHLPSAWTRQTDNEAAFEAAWWLLFPGKIPGVEELSVDTITEAIAQSLTLSGFQTECVRNGVHDTLDAMRCKEEGVTDWVEYLRVAVRSYGHQRFAGRTGTVRQLVVAAREKFWGKGLTPKQWSERMDRYRTRVAAVAGRYGEIHNMCPALDTATSELGITKADRPKHDLTFTGDGLTVKVTVQTWRSDDGNLRDIATVAWDGMSGEEQRAAVVSQEKINVNWARMKVV